MARDLPLLFLDVDGTLIPIGSFDQPVADHLNRPLPPALERALVSNPLLCRLDPGLGHWLSTLSCQLVWATTWLDDANDVVGPLLGLPELPIVRWSDHDDEGPGPVHWKTPGLVAFAAGRPFIWLDDEITGADREWVGVHHAGPVLLHRVAAHRGVTREDRAAVTDWLAQ